MHLPAIAVIILAVAPIGSSHGLWCRRPACIDGVQAGRPHHNEVRAMDISKLPKLSQSPPPPPPDSASPETSVPAPTRRVPDYRSPSDDPPLSAGEIWFSLIVGVIFLLLGWTFARFTIAKLTGQPFHSGYNWSSGPKTGQEVGYLELES